MKKIILSVTAGALAVGLYSCYSNPVTGRRALNIVSEDEMRAAANTEYAKFKAANPPVASGANADLVKRIGGKMAVAVQQYLNSINQGNLVSGYQWEFNLFNSNEANAWCMPGGKVAVYSGILPLTANEAGLAAVMGHEIAHAVARHANERMSQQVAGQTASQVLGSATGSQTFATVVGIGGTGLLLKFSRDQESEADRMGLIFMAMSGYNPNEAVTFWQRMSAKGGAKPPEILSTHPSDARRIADIKKHIPEAMKYYKP